MKYKYLGNTGIKVSKLCFGTLTLSPLQKNLSLKTGVKLLKTAVELGVNFFDTAQIYDNYEYLKEAFSKNDDVVIATKSYSYDKKTAKASLEKALRGLNRDYIDVFLLHEQESEHTLRGHMEAIEYFLQMKQKGIIKAFGISTHFIKGVDAALYADYIDVIHPILNKSGIGIVDGDVDSMLKSIKSAKNAGKGIYSMKPIGGGHLISDVRGAFDFVKGIDEIDSIAVGIQSLKELEYNASYLCGYDTCDKLENELKSQKRRLFIHNDWCVRCGKCIKRCQHGALSFSEGKLRVDDEKCVLCSYCSLECSEMAIKII